MGASGQAAELEAAHRGRVVSQARHGDLPVRAVPPFVAHPGRPPRQQTGHATFDHRAAVASGAGQLHLAWGTVASHPRGGEQLVDCRGRWRRGERFHRVRAPHREDPAGVEGRAQLCVGEGESAGPRVDGGGGPRGDVGESRLHFVDQGQPVAGSPRVAHGQVPGKNKAGGGLGDEARLTAKLRGTVALAFADGGKGRSVGMDNVTAGQGLVGGEAAGLGDDLLRGATARGSGVAQGARCSSVSCGALRRWAGAVCASWATAWPVVSRSVAVYRPKLTTTFPCPRHCRPKRRLILASSGGSGGAWLCRSPRCPGRARYGR